MEDKLIKGILVLDYRSGKIRLLNKSKRKYDAFEIPIHFNILVQVPEIKEHEFSGKITIPETKIIDMTLDQL